MVIIRRKKYLPTSDDRIGAITMAVAATPAHFAYSFIIDRKSEPFRYM